MINHNDNKKLNKFYGKHLTHIKYYKSGKVLSETYFLNDKEGYVYIYYEEYTFNGLLHNEDGLIEYYNNGNKKINNIGKMRNYIIITGRIL